MADSTPPGEIRGEQAEKGPPLPQTDSAVRPVREGELSAAVRGEIDAVYQRGWLATYLQDALAGHATPNKTMHALLDAALEEQNVERKLEARRGILKHILPKGITVNSRVDMNRLMEKMVLLGIHPVLWEASGEIKLGVRPGKEQKDRLMLGYDEIGIDISRFPISTKPGAPLTDFPWRGEGIVERRLPITEDE
jgi:hypothetical protein